MKTILAAFLLVPFMACSNQSDTTAALSKIDSLNTKINFIKSNYKPGLDEIMGDIQEYHAKLWFAGTNKNWKLAAYELSKIKENLQSARTIETDRPEVKSIAMIDPFMEGVSKAIDQKDVDAFRNSFQSLTNTCNACHTANHYDYNVITIPTEAPVTNQDFKPKP